MSRRLGFHFSAIRAASAMIALAVFVGCTDRSNGITGTGVMQPQSPAALPSEGLAIVQVTVDDAGNVTTSPLQGVSGNAATDADGSMQASSIYGTQNVNVRVYAAPATVTTVGNTKTWTMQFGVRNLLSFPIGSNQSGPIPSDTTGIFLAVISGPTVTQTSSNCPGSCAMSIIAYDGTGTFTAPNQRYVYWRERLAAKQPVAGADTVSARRTMKFTSPKQVTNFKFFLIVGADWPAPAQTNWSVFYNAPTDSAPDQHAKPIWRTGHMSLSGSATESWSKNAGVDSLILVNNKDYYLFRRDSLAASTAAYMEAHVKVNNGGQTKPETVFGFLDGARMAAVGMTSSQVGFVKYAFLAKNLFGHGLPQSNFVDSVAVNATASHTYRLRKFGADSVTLEVDGVRRLGLTYNQLPTAALDSVASFATGPAEFFGDGSISGNHNSAWSVLTYGIGATQP
jgi:hypothetical protein